MDVKRKTCDIRNLERNIYFPTCPPTTWIHLSHSLTSVSKPEAQKSFHCCLSHFNISVSTSSSSAKRLPSTCKRFTRQTLPTVNNKYFFMNILCTEFFCQQKSHNRTLLFGSIALKHRRSFDYWNQPMNMPCASATYAVMKMYYAAT
jgi:hypothetical protein